MPRPDSRVALLEAMTVEYDKLLALLTQLTPAQLEQAGACGSWSVKDLLAHLYAWQQMVVEWYHAGVRGERVVTPASDLSWKQIPTLNQRIYEQYKSVPLAEIQAKLNASHAETKDLLGHIPESELVTPNAYAWTKTTLLLSYFVSCTSSHYHWAYDEIRKWIKAQKPTTTPH